MSPGPLQMSQYIDLIEGTGLASLGLGLHLSAVPRGRLRDGHNGHQVLPSLPRSSLPLGRPVGGLYLYDGGRQQGVRCIVRQLLHHRRFRHLQILVSQQSSGWSRLDIPFAADKTCGRCVPGAVAGWQTVLRSAHAAADGATGSTSSSSAAAHAGAQCGQRRPGSK